MAFLRFLAIFIIAFIASVESFTWSGGRHGTVTAQFNQPQQQPAPQYPSQGQGTQQMQFAAPGQQQYPFRPPQNSQSYQFAPSGGQQFQTSMQFAPPAQNQFQRFPHAGGQFQSGSGFNPNFPGNQWPRPTPPGRYVTFRPITTASTPVPFQSLDEAQPNVIPSGGIPTWILRYLLLTIVQKSTTDTTVTTTTAATRYVLPSTYSDWFKYGNCVYKSFATPATWDDAKTACSTVGSKLASVNVKEQKARNDIFGGTSLLTDKAWLGLKDIDGPQTPFSAQWSDLATFVPGIPTPTYTTTNGTRSCAFVGVAGAFTFTNCDAATQKYLCEFCPTF